jgi:hypothetical protein
MEDRARFAAAQARCANTLIFGRKGMPTEMFTRGSGQLVIREPIIVDRNVVQATLPSAPAVNTCLEIVPWKPVRDVIALQLLPAFIESRREAIISEKSAPTAPVIILGGPIDSSPLHFEFQMGQNQPSPSKAIVYKRRKLPAKKRLALPTVVSTSCSSTPLIQSSVRRSTRLGNKEGYCSVKLAADPSKKRKTCAVMIDETTGETGPVPIPILQGWGIDCGVDPSDLTEEALLQAPAEQVNNDQSAE